MSSIPHLQRSRIEKAITDAAGSEQDFDQAAAALDAVKIAVTVDDAQLMSAAGQSAVLTILNTAIKCFGSAELICTGDAALRTPVLFGKTLVQAARTIGAEVATEVSPWATHVVAVGAGGPPDPFVRCWWDGWLAGLRPAWEDAAVGDSCNPLSGVFAGALAVREVFANAVGRRLSFNRPTTVNLWSPWSSEEEDAPLNLSLPSKLWLVGLGHLGQGFLWSLALLPVADCHVLLQDDQTVGEENVATGLVTLFADVENSNRKTRVAARWLEAAGWTTSIIERRNYGDLKLTTNDPPIILTSIDEPRARVEIAKAGHEYLIDAGVGHGAFDFEIAQIRIIPNGVDAASLWAQPEQAKDVETLLKRRAYSELARKFDNCGTFSLAEASVAVPFVGAAVGALTITQLLRLTALRTTPQIMQVELAAADAGVAGILNPLPAFGLGGSEFQLREQGSR
ncbi:MAG: hypothetical protein DI533_17355 [Cereibacter sphaeroides]|uniref:THIF-type NAD/FAD binding fold domain-containing protein n=1 Tax=Cereibacter sphaeroides TaxID=1063 RepID=A0A2W5RZX5_CERSP|nr:MAG: hypothetical protein DI533_17355 [Cereibacter sphaeroides]